MAKRLFLGLAFHNHQPVGNFESVFAESTARAYLPMLDLLERHPHLRVSLHYGGALLDWLRSNEPSFLSRIAALVRHGQVELMTGGYYEPILVALPDVDKHGQIEMMNQVLRNEFGTDPTGMWLAERVWEPTLPLHIARKGLDWTILDDTHFKMVGLNDDDLWSYYMTEEQGYPLKLFSTSQQLRYMIPWKSVSEVIDYLRSQASEESERIAVIGDDGEKLGAWPGTYKLCWQDGWMEEFAQALKDNADWLHLILLGEYARHYPAAGRIYLPAGSYAEMLEWALPADDAQTYSQLVRQLEAQGRTDIIRWVRGSFWRNFMVKYPEINLLHKKMLLVHNKVYGIDHDTHSKVTRQPTGDRRIPHPQALDELWQGQANDAYWHGIFGGIYMADLRATTYQHLVQAESIADRDRHGTEDWLTSYRFDYDRDSRPEVLLEGSIMNVYLKPDEGGCILEWDDRAKAYNLASSMTRRKEAYHQTLIDYEAQSAEVDAAPQSTTIKGLHESVRTKEPGLVQRLYYDWYQRRSLIDHCLHPNTGLDDFIRCRYGEQGDFVDQPFRCRVEQVAKDKSLLATLTRDGHIWFDDQFLPLQLIKRIRMDARTAELHVEVTLLNQSELDIEVLYGSEWNLNLLGGNHNPSAYYILPGRESELGDNHLDSTGELNNISQIGLRNSWLDITAQLQLSKPSTLWRFPIETISTSEAGFERLYQSTCLLPFWRIILGAGQNWSVELTWKLS